MANHNFWRVAAAASAVALLAAGCSGKGSNTAGSNGNAGGNAGGGVVNASKCPTDATKALGAGEDLKVGTIMPLSGPVAVIGKPIEAGIHLYFDELNAKGGVDGHKIDWIAKDDSYDPTRTVPEFTQLIQRDKVMATAGQAGGPNIAAARTLAEKSCTPQLFVVSGVPAFSDPAAHPWTINFNMSYTSEAKIWGQTIAKAKPGAKVAYLAVDNEAGKAYTAGFTEAAKADGLTIVASAKHAATAASLDNEVTNLLAAKPDYVILMSVGAACAKGIGALAQSGYTGKTISAVSCTSDAILPKLGAAANGVEYMSQFVDVNDTSNADIKAFHESVAKYGNGLHIEPEVLSGYRLGDLFAKTVEGASKLKGGLTRVNLMEAAWHIDTPWIGGFGGNAKADGATNPYLMEEGQMMTWDAAAGKGKTLGTPVDIEGKSVTTG